MGMKLSIRLLYTSNLTQTLSFKSCPNAKPGLQEQTRKLDQIKMG